ncbi:unnamed protein product [Hymenolepis diminuta]|uniref:Uncharacterized protein n=1 Tax=Hymenolepis diminuta TaxID=6216 RepID=A0A564YQ92_HYMDI|nr:unnamed protein product [Hymenolepis diminuta]
MSHRPGKGKHTSDDSSRHYLVGPAINQSCLHRLLPFLQSSRPIKARIQPYPYACPHLPLDTHRRVDPSSTNASPVAQSFSYNSLLFLETLY